MELMPAGAQASGRHLYRPCSLPVNLQHVDQIVPPLTSPDAASATDDETKGMPLTSLRRGSDLKLQAPNSVAQAAVPSLVHRSLHFYTSTQKFSRPILTEMRPRRSDITFITRRWRVWLNPKTHPSFISIITPNFVIICHRV